MASASNEPAEVRVERIATGGEGVGRLDDGRVVFVRGALPGEVASIEIIEEKKRFARGVASSILESSPDRIEPSCAHASQGDCGGCDWLHVRPERQRAFKEAIVTEQLERLGGVASPTVVSAIHERGRRTTVRCSVTSGRAGYRSRRSNSSFAAAECQAAHPALEALIVDGFFGDATEVTLRVGEATGDLMVITNGPVHDVQVPDGVQVVAAGDPGTAAIYEEVAGRRWRISAGSFFQTSQAGAQALVSAVQRGIEHTNGDIVDLYGGVGLLGGGAGAERAACVVESNPASAADARHNLGAEVNVVQVRVERWTPSEFATVIADPARRGLGKEGVAKIDQTKADRLVLVSCDPASLGRDTGLLAQHGWQHTQAQVIDMFPDTSRLEVVSTFTR